VETPTRPRPRLRHRPRDVRHLRRRPPRIALIGTAGRGAKSFRRHLSSPCRPRHQPAPATPG
jgi:hypothetical protein